MATIHHNTLKKAAKLGLAISEHEDERTGSVTFAVSSIAKGAVLAHATDPKDALELAILELSANVLKFKAPKAKKTPKAKKARKPRDEEGEDGEDGEEELSDEELGLADEEGDDSGKSVVKAKYKAKYRPHKMTCGDDLAQKVRAKFMTVKDADTGRPRLDFNAFVAFAKANECWVESYRTLKNRHGGRNNGLIRMNVINRLRARIRKDLKIIWS